MSSFSSDFFAIMDILKKIYYEKAIFEKRHFRFMYESGVFFMPTKTTGAFSALEY